MPGFELTEVIARPPGEVFALLTDPERVPLWLPEVVRQERLTEGPTGVGTRLRETRRVMGREAQAELEVVAYEPPARYAVRTHQSGAETTYTYTLRPEDGATRVRLVADVRAAAGWRRLSALLLSAVLKRQDKEHLAKLKAAVERAEPTAA